MFLSDWVRSQADTRVQVAKRLGISRDALHKLMRGQVFPRGSTRLAIARETEGAVSAADLVASFNAFQAAHTKAADAPVS